MLGYASLDRKRTTFFDMMPLKDLLRQPRGLKSDKRRSIAESQALRWRVGKRARYPAFLLELFL